MKRVVAKAKATSKAKGPRSPDPMDALVREALVAQGRAYAPYSKFHVGAALLTKSGRVFLGCNVENASYPVGICAERTAIVAMVAAGEREPVALAIVTPGKRGGSPCGLCRQTLGEFARVLPIALVGAEGGKLSRRDTNISALLPDAFDFEAAHDPRLAAKAPRSAQKKRKPKPIGA